MGAKLRRHFQSNVVGYIALFVAMSGSAYAVTTAPKNSVATKSIKKNAVTRAKIAKNAVTSRAVKDRSLTARDINTAGLGSVPSAAHASTADNATNAANATNATNAATAQNAAHAADADKLGGAGPDAFLKGAAQFPAGGDLTGTYASPTIGQGRIGSGKIGNGAIVGEDIAPNAVDSGKISNASILGEDVAANTLGGAQISEGSLNGVDADELGGLNAGDFVRNGSAFAHSSARNFVNTATAPANTLVLESSRYEVRTAGQHQFKVCNTLNVTEYVSITTGTAAAPGIRGFTQIVPPFDCGAAFTTGGSGSSTPGSFTVYGPDAVMFGGPSIESTAVVPTAARYSITGIGFVVEAP